MLEKRFLDLIVKYKQQVENISHPNENFIQRLKYINQCLDHLENEIDDLNLDINKPETKIYEDLQKIFGPMILSYLISSKFH